MDVAWWQCGLCCCFTELWIKNTGYFVQQNSFQIFICSMLNLLELTNAFNSLIFRCSLHGEGMLFSSGTIEYAAISQIQIQFYSWDALYFFLKLWLHSSHLLTTPQSQYNMLQRPPPSTRLGQPLHIISFLTPPQTNALVCLIDFGSNKHGCQLDASISNQSPLMKMFWFCNIHLLQSAW